MAITQAVCNSFKVEILKALHNFTATTGNAFKLALYDSEATLSKSTTIYDNTRRGRCIRHLFSWWWSINIGDSSVIN